MIDLIYCANGNARFAQIAIDHGFRYGAQLPNTIHHPPYFADQDWKNPDRDAYMAALAEHKPTIATVLDFEHRHQLQNVLAWAEEAAAHVDTVIIIPKAPDTIHLIPTTIAGKQIRLGYSVPTRFGGTQVPIWEFGRRPVHLLGGSPQKQMELAHYLNVKSVDGNMMLKLATTRCQFWTAGDARYAKNRWWPMISEADEQSWNHDAPYEAFRRSCANISNAWKTLNSQPATHNTRRRSP